MKTKEIIKDYLNNPNEETFQKVCDNQLARELLHHHYLDFLKENLSVKSWILLFQSYGWCGIVRDHGIWVIKNVAKTFDEKYSVLFEYVNQFGQYNTKWEDLKHLISFATTNEELRKSLHLGQSGNGGLYREEGTKFRATVIRELEDVATECVDWCYIYHYTDSWFTKRKAKKKAKERCKTLQDKIYFYQYILRKDEKIDKEKEEKEIVSLVKTFEDLKFALKKSCLKKDVLESYNPSFEELEQLFFDGIEQKMVKERINKLI